MEGQQKPNHQPESRRTLVIFFTFGFLASFLFSTVTAGAEDLLIGFSSSTGMIWLFLALPSAILSTTVPYFFDRLSPLHIILALFPLVLGGLLALILGRTEWLKYLSVTIFGIILSLSRITSVSLTAYFDVVTVKFYCVGTGFGYVAGPFYYTAMSSWFHVSSDASISAVVIFHSVIFLSCYLMLENRREKLTEYKTIDKDEEHQHDQQHDIRKSLSVSEKFYTSLDIFPKVMQIVLGILFHDLVLCGITTTIAFPGSPFSPSDHYKYYLIMSFAGLCLGRSYLGIAECVRRGLSDMLVVRRTWTLVALAGLHVVLLILDSLYRFLPNVWVILLLAFSLGFWTESIYLNVNVNLGEIQDSRARELSMGLAVFGVGFGALVGAILSGPVEQVLVKHCLQSINQTSYCLTREKMHLSKY